MGMGRLIESWRTEADVGGFGMSQHMRAGKGAGFGIRRCDTLERRIEQGDSRQPCKRAVETITIFP